MVTENDFISLVSNSDTQLIFATYVQGEFEYYISPPKNWNKADKEIVMEGFDNFNFGSLYATYAADLLPVVLGQIEALKRRGLSVETICCDLLQPAVDSAPFVNHWQRGMYQALIQELSNS